RHYQLSSLENTSMGVLDRRRSQAPRLMCRSLTDGEEVPLHRHRAIKSDKWFDPVSLDCLLNFYCFPYGDIDTLDVRVLLQRFHEPVDPFVRIERAEGVPLDELGVPFRIGGVGNVTREVVKGDRDPAP